MQVNYLLRLSDLKNLKMHWIKLLSRNGRERKIGDMTRDDRRSIDIEKNKLGNFFPQFHVIAFRVCEDNEWWIYYEITGAKLEGELVDFKLSF
jgi:hypothetical protein